MEQLILAYYLVCLTFMVLPGIAAFDIWKKKQSPLAKTYYRLQGMITLFLSAIVLDDEILKKLFPHLYNEWQIGFATLFFLLYGGLGYFFIAFFSELQQKPLSSLKRAFLGIYLGIGFFLPFLINTLILDTAIRVDLMPKVLNGVYIPLFFFILLGLFWSGFRSYGRITDAWKKTTMKGIMFVILAGMPIFIWDDLWPFINLPNIGLPYLFPLVMVVWSFFFLSRWWVFSEIDKHEIPDQKIVLLPDKLLHLTDREKEVVMHIVQGQSNQEIAQNLNVTVGTVKNHIYNIFNKTGASSRKELGVLLSS